MRKFITVMISAKTVFSSFLANRDPDFLSLKPSWDQDEDNDICYSPIGSAVFELNDTQTNKQTDRQTSYITHYLVTFIFIFNN